MKILNHTFFICLLGMSPVSCSHARQQKTKEFHLSDVPVTLAAPKDRAAYLSLHYRDYFNFADTSLIPYPKITEQAFVDFLGILSYTDRTQVAINTLLHRAITGQGILYHFIRLNDRYLYEPNLPTHDEKLHVLVLRALLDDPCLSDTDKICSHCLLKVTMKNRPGDVAADFTVTCRGDRRRQLSGIKAGYALVYFSDPDCEDCCRMKELLALSPVVNGLLESGRLKFLSVCVEGKIPAWEKVEFPAGWMDGYDADQRLTREQVYDLKAIPALYLLGTEKRVILKDASFEQMGERLF